MFGVLQDWEEIGQAILELQRLGLPLHHTPQKNWDHCMLLQALDQVPKDTPIADLGCGEGHTLRVPHSIGFHALEGVDFKIPLILRARQALSMYRTRTARSPYRLWRCDLHRTPLHGERFGAVVSISTIEHGVDLPRFLGEAARALRPNGLLFITTDYWEDKIDTSNTALAFGLPWKIFNRDDILDLVSMAERAGLRPVADSGIQGCSGRPVCWNDRAYTFIAMLFRQVR